MKISFCAAMLFATVPALAQFTAGSVLPFSAAFSFQGAVGNEPSFDVVAQPANVNVLSIQRSAGVAPTPAPGMFGAVGWTTGKAVDPRQYFEFKVSPNSGPMTLVSLVFNQQCEGQSPTRWSLRSSLDDYSADVASSSVSQAQTLRMTTGVNLGAPFENLSQGVTFRLYGFAAPSLMHTLGGWPVSASIPMPSTGAWMIDDLRLDGFTVVPEPAQTGLLLALGMVGYAIVRRTQSKPEGSAFPK